MNRIQGDVCPNSSPKRAILAFVAAVTAEAEADERYNAMARMRPGDASPVVARILEGRYSRLLEARAEAEARATEALRVLGTGGLLGAWLSSIGEDD